MSDSSLLNLFIFVGIIYLLVSRIKPVKGLKNLKEMDFRKEIGEGNKIFLMDVREPHEYIKGYIPGAVNIPLSQLKDRISEIPKEKSIFLYCHSGMRSKAAAKILSVNGINNLSHLQGGIMSWKGNLNKR